jgi:catechol 2,3-dioxygenase-like lactoylglutathione lyase family enzyme
MSVTAMEHVLVLSDDIEATRDFYCQVVGLQVGERPPLEFPGYWLYAGPTACVHVAERRAYASHAAGLGLDVPEDPPGPGPVDHIAFNASDYDAVTARLQSHGVAAVSNVIPDGGPRQLFIEDPNGVRIEINVRHLPNQAR